MAHIPLEGPANFRDLGGCTNRAGCRVRTRRVYRSDSLSHMTDGDVRHCIDELGLRTVVDLRAGHEVDEFSHGPLEAAGVQFLHRPVIDETRERPSDVAPELLTVEQVYLLMLERFGGRLADVVGIVADPLNHPLVFHCAAGKDRTGLVAALVLGALDVDDDVIAADYARTAEIMPVLMARHRAIAASRGRGPEVAREHFVAEASTMRTVLAELRVRFGSIDEYLYAAGLPYGTVASLRGALLE